MSKTQGHLSGLTNKIIVLDDADTLMERLKGNLGDDPQHVKHLYPLLTRHAGKPMDGAGMALVAVEALAVYLDATSSELPPDVAGVMGQLFTSTSVILGVVATLTDHDPDIFAEAKRALDDQVGPKKGEGYTANYVSPNKSREPEAAVEATKEIA